MKIIPTVAVLFFLSFSVVTAQPAEAPSVKIEIPIHKITVEDKILTTFNDRRMVAVFHCESGLKQFDKNGNPKMSPTHDVGIGQVNQVHWKRAKKLGLDVFNSVDDNLKMSKIVYDEQGIEAWTVYKSKCYNNYLNSIS